MIDIGSTPDTSKTAHQQLLVHHLIIVKINGRFDYLCVFVCLFVCVFVAFELDQSIPSPISQYQFKYVRYQCTGTVIRKYALSITRSG
jgi:hypothetical protein